MDRPQRREGLLERGFTVTIQSDLIDRVGALGGKCLILALPAHAGLLDSRRSRSSFNGFCRKYPELAYRLKAHGSWLVSQRIDSPIAPLQHAHSSLKRNWLIAGIDSQGNAKPLLGVVPVINRNQGTEYHISHQPWNISLSERW